MIDKKAFTDYLYNKLPAVYRQEDANLGQPLYRYLKSLCEGGFAKVVEDSNNFLNLIDPEKCPEELFPYLYESFGLVYFQDIPVEYHRKFLNNLGALTKRRGTYTAVRYLVSTLTGFEVDLSYERLYNEDTGECKERVLNIVLNADSVDKVLNVTPSIEVIKNFIHSQIPFYITPVFSAYIETSQIVSTMYRTGAISSQATTYICPFERVKNSEFVGIQNNNLCISMSQHQTISP